MYHALPTAPILQCLNPSFAPNFKKKIFYFIPLSSCVPKFIVLSLVATLSFGRSTCSQFSPLHALPKSTSFSWFELWCLSHPNLLPNPRCSIPIPKHHSYHPSVNGTLHHHWLLPLWAYRAIPHTHPSSAPNVALSEVHPLRNLHPSSASHIDPRTLDPSTLSLIAHYCVESSLAQAV